MTEQHSTVATSVLALARAGRFAEIREMYVPALRGMVTADALEAAWTAEVAAHGQVVDTGAAVTEAPAPDLTMVKIPVRLERGEITLVVTMTGTAELAGLQLASAAAAEPMVPWQPPEYADPATFDEREVTLDDVPGTLTVPVHQTGVAVLLLSGSGPLDRDGAVGRNKPLKDLAWGLATRGVTVLRFDKITHAHPDRVGVDFTVVDEYVHHALAGIRLLDAGGYQGRIFVVGHSLGGTVAPRVAAAAAPDVAGIVLLAAGAVPIHRSAVRQVRYLAGHNPGAAGMIEPLTRQAALVDSPDLSPATPAADLPFGVPAPYWLDLRRYDPVVAARELRKPVLIVQGGRDYQVTVDDDLPLWTAGLPDATVRVHPADNHMFFRGGGPSTDADYEAAQHVDAEVVAEVADWLSSAR